MEVSIKNDDFNKFIGKKTIFLGGRNSERTGIICKILEQGVARRYRGISVIDMAPQQNVEGSTGSSLPESIINLENIRIFIPRRVYEPRAEGKDSREVSQLAVWNARNIGSELRKFQTSPSRALFINDITMYLHKGPLAILLKAISKSHTFVGTGFRGVIPHDDLETGISRREKKLVDKLTHHMDDVISV